MKLYLIFLTNIKFLNYLMTSHLKIKHYIKLFS